MATTLESVALLRRALRTMQLLPYPAMRRKGRSVWCWLTMPAGGSGRNTHSIQTVILRRNVENGGRAICSPFFRSANVRDVFELYRGESDASKAAAVRATWAAAVATLEQLVRLPADTQAQLFDAEWHAGPTRTPR